VPAKSSDRSANLSLAARALERSLRRVRTEQALAADNLAPESVHDLRVALRRCRSLAEGFSDLNPHAEWRHLRKACKTLLRGLAELRDNQVMEEWARRLGIQKGPAGAALMESLERENKHARRVASRALADFSGKRWKRWRKRLPERAGRIRAAEAHFTRLAWRRLSEARDRERRWRSSGSGKAAHRLRVAVKRFRYLIASFLPERRAAWGGDLKRLQSLLGEIHDLDVLRLRVLKVLRIEKVHEAVRQKWLGKIERARAKAVEDYWRAIMLKPAPRRPAARARTLWDRWERKLAQLAGVTFPIYEGPSRSSARRARPAARKSSPFQGTPRRLSGAM
jgi:CHAD domain-containing protein